MSSNGQREPHDGRLGVRVIPRTGREVSADTGLVTSGRLVAISTKCPQGWACLGQRDQRGVIPMLCCEGS